MFKLNLKIALRNLWKQKGYSAINVFGLATGLCTFFLIAFYVADDLSYDRYHKNADRIFRVIQSANWDGGSFKIATTSGPFAKSLKADFPVVEEAVRLVPEAGGLLSTAQKEIKTGDIFFADNSIFKVFDYDFLYGNKSNALLSPDAIVISRDLAESLFGNAESAIGKTILIDRKISNKVTGVIENIPGNSHIKFRALRSLPANWAEGWQEFHIYTYILLAPHASYKQLDAKLPAFYEQHLKGEMGIADYKISLQPLTAIHLHSDLSYEIGPNGNIKYVSIFIAAACLILVIAIINYMNLATARSTSRAREVGVRKAIGAERKQIMISFWLESVLLTFIACLLAALIAELVMPYFNQLSGKILSVWKYGYFPAVLFISAFSLLTGTLSGSYPAFFLSGFPVVNALKGTANMASGHGFLRKGLVVFQFVITITMIIISWVIYIQMQYVLKTNLGFDKEQVLTFHIDELSVRSKTEALKTALLQSPFIKKVGVAGNPIGNNDIGSNGLYFETDKGFNPGTNMAQILKIDEDLLPAMGITMAAGRNFSAQLRTDKLESVLINQTMAKELGLKNAIGKRVRSPNVNEDGKHDERTIIGVVKDFHTYSLQHKIQGMILVMPAADEERDNLYVRIDPAKAKEAMAWTKTVYSRFDKANIPDFKFLDENFSRQYQAESRQGNLLMIFTCLAIFIALLGLYGLSTFITAQRTKEIAVRRVLGASSLSIISLLNMNFIRIAGIASLISWPLAYFFCTRWLQDFAYHITLPVNPFLFSSLFCLLIVVLTVSIKAVEAAKTNPVKALKYE